VSVGAVSVMDNHLHLLVRLDPEVARGWSDEEVVRRWGSLFPRGTRTDSRYPSPKPGSNGGSKTPRGWRRCANACRA
jgi:hypothetical protein